MHADARMAHKGGALCLQHRFQTAEGVEQIVGKRIRILIGNGVEEEHFENLVRQKRLRTRRKKALSHAASVSCMDALDLTHRRSFLSCSPFEMCSVLLYNACAKKSTLFDEKRVLLLDKNEKNGIMKAKENAALCTHEKAKREETLLC